MYNTDFSLVEYVVCFGVLGASAAIGVWFGCIKKTEDTVNEYMLGGKKMPVLPTAMSLVAGFVSGITLLGFPAEVYLYGTQLAFYNLAFVFVGIILYYFFLPVTFNLGATSVFEYLERRFNKTVRKIGSAMFAFALVTYIPVVIYVPSLAFSQVTGISLYRLAPIICAICIFYTTLGGLKAVVYSDALQSLFTITTVIVVAVLGVQSAGGMKRIWEVCEEGNRIEIFNMDPDPFKRASLVSVMIGSMVTWTAHFAIHPGTYQRFTSLKSFSDAKILIYIMAGGLFIVKFLSSFIGMIIYTKYHDCDPVLTKEISKPDQILPFYVVDVAGDYPGITGLFLSGVISTALSTMSTGLNTVSGTIFEDFIKPALPWKLSERQSNLTMKGIVIALGALCTGLVLIVEKLGAIMQVALSFQGITNGTLLYIFVIGMFFPWANSKGAIAGAVAGFSSVTWISFMAQYAHAAGRLTYPPKKTSLNGCPVNMTFPEGLNYTTVHGYSGYGSKVVYDEDLPSIYRITFLYYSVIGLSVGLVVALVVSFITGPQDAADIDPALIVPQMRRFIKNKHKSGPTREETAPALYKLVPINEINS